MSPLASLGPPHWRERALDALVPLRLAVRVVWYTGRLRLRRLAWHAAGRRAGRPAPLRGFWLSSAAWLASRRARGTLPPGAAVIDLPRSPVTLVKPLTHAANRHVPHRLAHPLSPMTVRVVAVPNARVCTDCGDVVTAEGELLLDLSLGRPEFMKPEQRVRALFDVDRLPPPTHLPGRAVLLASRFSGDNVYHLYLETLPRVEALRRAGIAWRDVDHVLVMRGQRPVTEALLKCGVPLAKVVWLEPDAHFQTDLLWTTTSLRHLGVKPQWVYEFLRRQFVTEATAAPRRRLYISRQEASLRRLLNEPEVLALLAPHGFESVVLTGRTLAEQAALFASAEMVVAPHGAGLANIVFCRPGTPVLEVLPPGFIHAHYHEVASGARLRYYYVMGAYPPGKTGAIAPDYRDDYCVPIDHLAATARLAGMLPP